MLDKLTNQMQETIDSAVSLALHSKNKEIDSLHMVWALITNTNSVLNQTLNKMNTNKTAIELSLKSEIEKLPKVSQLKKEDIKGSSNLVRSLQTAEGYMTKQGDKFIAVDTWLIANKDILKGIFSKFIDFSEFMKTLEMIRGSKKVETQLGDDTLEALEQYGIDLNKKALDGQLDPVIGRDEELQRVIQILIRKTKNNYIGSYFNYTWLCRY